MSMEKNWLIRTKSNHILGPITKEKVLELLNNGSIKPDDEVCSGNGFWFFIREEEMVERFLLGNELQSFNPMSEAKDVLTNHEPQKAQAAREVHEAEEDITQVGLTLTPDRPLEVMDLTPEEDLAPEEGSKKKSDFEKQLRPATPKARPPVAPRAELKKHDYFTTLTLIGFLILVTLIYFRKIIIRHIFVQESSSISFIQEVHAQEEIPAKKKLLDQNISLANVTFRPNIGLDGFRVVSELSVEELKCSELSNEINQLAIVLYPADRINEKFLIKMRDCVLKLPEDHPIKRWLKNLSKVTPLSKGEQEKRQFLVEIINSHFNLITDQNLKVKIANSLSGFPEHTLPERLLKSYLYLIIGNITRSDNLLKEYIKNPPYLNWRGGGVKGSFYHQLAQENMDQILLKLAKHPADRKVYQLLANYMMNYSRDTAFVDRFTENSDVSMGNSLKLLFVEKIAPPLVKFLRLQSEEENAKFAKLRDPQFFSFDDQAYWVWPFSDIDPLISDVLYPTVAKIEKDDQLWFIYLMDNEKLSDMYFKKAGKSFLPGRRHYLRTLLEDRESFMLALYKLIELGDFDGSLVQKTVSFFEND